MLQRDEMINTNDMFTLSLNELQKVDFYDTLFTTDTLAVLDEKETFSDKLFYRYQPTNYSFLEYIFEIYPFEKKII